GELVGPQPDPGRARAALASSLKEGKPGPRRRDEVLTFGASHAGCRASHKGNFSLSIVPCGRELSTRVMDPRCRARAFGGRAGAVPVARAPCSAEGKTMRNLRLLTIAG